MTTGRFKKIWDRNDLELEETINKAIAECDKLIPLNQPGGGRELFYTLLAGFDAYLEKRKRKDGIGLQSTPKDFTKGE